MLFALTAGGLSQRKVVGWVRRLLSGRLSPATIGAVLEQAQEQVKQRRREAIPPKRYRAIIVDRIYLQYRPALRQRRAKVCCWRRWGCGKAADLRLDWRVISAETTEDYKELLKR